MKLIAVAAALAALLPAAAPAQRVVVHERTVVRHERGHARQVCTWQRRHGHRVRVCRTVRY